MKKHAVIIDVLARRAALGTLLVASLFSGSQAFAIQIVRVAAVHFPPYMVRPEKGEDTGLLPKLVSALNAEQDDYRFVMVPTSVPRRFRDFSEGRFDVAIFENPEWGWKDIAHQTVDMGLEDAEVYVARRAEGRQQDYFNDLHGKRLAIFSGYHYGFANFNADQKYLAEHFNVTSTYSHDSNLLMVLRDRADIAPVTRSYLIDFMSRNKDEASQLLVSERVDQIYRQYALMRPNGAIDGAQFSLLLRKLREEGTLDTIFQPLNIKVLPVQAGAAVQ
ncbi:amino acid ABC transporter substrate-binding protein [Pseudomonas floridensis]|uniref:Amino acid ABC transporter substrate-binding protein n=1 Tax=Pseudomonas floridensis TaxID=1958950 RepID=A0A1X0N9P9_9PSED|nr:ABC transporter substrate-binding protein [Pseudomonas floridensis]ORC60649.1 amino acid ABC transporter substrate-binding protein [Pseudomonas floridensis]